MLSISGVVCAVGDTVKITRLALPSIFIDIEIQYNMCISIIHMTKDTFNKEMTCG
jgi:hypothetical protein